MMEQRSLKILETDKTFFTKITTTISKLLIPTKVGINGILISMKRNNLLKAYESYINNEQEAETRRYEETYSLYLESIDKYIMDSVYKKVKAGTASNFEAEALSKYYTIVHLKENEYIEYKHRKQKYLLELDYETIVSLNKEKLLERYRSFYISKMDSLYKGILKNYSIQLADVNAAKFRSNDEIYNKIFACLEEYISSILPIKLEYNANDEAIKQIVTDYEKYERFAAGKLDELDILEKNAILLGISRSLFTHSIPLIIAEQCYIKLLKDARKLIVNSKNERKANETYKMLITIIEEYNIKLLSTKVYWDKPEEKETYKKFWEEYKNISKPEEKEILFIKYDLKKLRTSKKDYSNIIKFYKEKLVEYGAIRQVKDKCKTLAGNYIKIKEKTV